MHSSVSIPGLRLIKNIPTPKKKPCVSRYVIAYIGVFNNNGRIGMKIYTVSRVAKMARVSVWTLHHYDHIGLLTPSKSEKGYRHYSDGDLLRLQHIRFYAELDVLLAEIKSILDDPDFDRVEALKNHRQLLEQRHDRIAVLLNTIDKTICALTEDNVIMNEEELYEGFSREKIDRLNKEVNEQYDPELVRQSREKVKNIAKGEWKNYKEQSEALNQKIAAQMDYDPTSPEVQALIARHHNGIEFFYTANAEIYSGLGQLYVENPEFSAYYEKYRTGMAHFMRDGMRHFADTVLVKKE
jgi:DNA-binding transcriptional MerR regulator